MPVDYRDLIRTESSNGLGVCAISCWEVAKLVEIGRLHFSIPLAEWIARALLNVQLLPLSPEIAIESSQLPGSFHRDPADQLIVATARFYDCRLLTMDRLIQDYPHVRMNV